MNRLAITIQPRVDDDPRALLTVFARRAYEQRAPGASKDMSDIYNNRAFVEDLYWGLLGRAPDIGGWNGHVSNLEAGKVSRRQLIVRILESVEYRSRQAQKGTDNAPEDNIYTTFETLESHGCKFVLPKTSAVAAALRSGRGYEPWAVPYFLEHCLPGMTVVDIGASWGVYALPAAKRVGAGGMVYAIEVSPLNCKIILQSVQASNISNIKLLPVGVSDHLGSELLGSQRKTNNNVIKSGREWEVRSFNDTEIVSVVPLDLLRHSFGKVDLIKIDIEGMEYKAFMGGKQLLTEQKPVVFMEYSPTFQRSHSGVDGRDLLNIFMELDYQVEILHRGKAPEKVEVDSKSEIIDYVDHIWAEHVQVDRGTHLDLKLFCSK